MDAADRYAEARSHLRRADPVIARLIDEHPGFDPRAWLARLPRRDVFAALLYQVIGQQLSLTSARAIAGRLEALFAGRLPTPQQLLAADPEAVRAAGLSHRKVQTLRAVAQRFAAGELSEAFFRNGTDEEIEAKLTAVPGIGPWTVRTFMIVALDRPDVVPTGDLALRHAVRRLYHLAELPTEQEVLRIAEPWRPYRTLATAYLFRSELDARTAGGDAEEQPGVS